MRSPRATAAYAGLSRSRAQPLRHLGREVADDEVGTRATDPGQRLEHRGPLVDPALRRRGLDQAVLARDLVGDDRDMYRLMNPADDVEVGAGGFHHHEIRALPDVELHLSQCLAC